MRALSVLALFAGLLVVAQSASPQTLAKHPSSLTLIRKGLAKAVARGELTARAATDYRGIALRAQAELSGLPAGRAENLAGVLADVASQSWGYTPPRALALFSTLELNTQRLASGSLPPSGTTVSGDDGVQYRFFPGHGFAFHPLANFSQLNVLAALGNVDATEQLAAALEARGIPARGGLVWEYGFPFGGGRPPWTSGMAQAVAAQAFAHAGDLLSNPALLDVADAAYHTIPGLVLQLPEGPWIRLYSFSRVAVLNAQLQTMISLGDYAEISGSDEASALAQRLQAAAKTLLPRFDTGYWSLYSLGGSESPRNYHDYVVSLLRLLEARDGDPLWKSTADRFAAYETQPPIIKPGASVPTLYPVPADGYRDVARFRFWLSKLSYVTLAVGGKHETLKLGHGPHALLWAPGYAPPRAYHPLLRAEDQNGHRVSVALAPVVVRHDRSVPQLDVRVTGPSTVRWSSTDEGTPWLAIAVHLDAGSVHRVMELGRRGTKGRVALRLPPGRWHARLVAENSAGRARSVSLGFLPRSG
jgi:D-glucuronyl C5-epimerase C-terminus